MAKTIILPTFSLEAQAQVPVVSLEAQAQVPVVSLEAQAQVFLQSICLQPHFQSEKLLWAAAFSSIFFWPKK